MSELHSRAAFSELAESVRALGMLDRRARYVAAAVAIGEALIAALMVAPWPLAAAGFTFGVGGWAGRPGHPFPRQVIRYHLEPKES